MLMKVFLAVAYLGRQVPPPVADATVRGDVLLTFQIVRDGSLSSVWAQRNSSVVRIIRFAWTVTEEHCTLFETGQCAVVIE